MQHIVFALIKISWKTSYNDDTVCDVRPLLHFMLSPPLTLNKYKTFRNSTHRCTSLTCITCVTRITCITCITCNTWIKLRRLQLMRQRPNIYHINIPLGAVHILRNMGWGGGGLPNSLQYYIGGVLKVDYNITALKESGRL